MILPLYKRCPHCGTVKPASEFGIRKDSPGGALTSWCKTCNNQRISNYYKAHPDKQLERARKYRIKYPGRQAAAIERWRQSHRERVRLVQKKWQESHRGQRREACRRWAHAHPDKVLAKALRHQKRKKAQANIRAARHRLRKLHLLASLTMQEWDDLLAAYHYSCAYCGKAWHELDHKLQQEHIIPVVKGGSYTKDNIVPACRRCNAKKGGRTPEEAGMQLRQTVNIR